MHLQPLIKWNKIISYCTFKKIHPAFLSEHICCLLTNSRCSRSGPVSNREAHAELLSRATCSTCCLDISGTLGKLCLSLSGCIWGNGREFLRSVLESTTLEKNQPLPRVTDYWYVAWTAITAVIHRDVSFKIRLLEKALLERATHLWNSLPVVRRELARFVNPPS